MSESSAIGAPTFIVGVMNRCGTNYLADLLFRHPEFERPPQVGEDYLFHRADLLDEYIAETTRHWSKQVRAESGRYRSQLLRAVGATLVAGLQAEITPGKRLVLKTPRAENVGYFDEMIERGKLLLIMRDGRDVTESATRSFRRAGPELWASRWASGVNSLFDFMEADRRAEADRRWLYLTYEDLFRDTRTWLERVLRFVDVEPSTYPWEDLDGMPLRGSSTARQKGEDLHWQPVEKPKDFNPIGRWGGWGWRQKRRFKKIAGRELVRAGYVENDRW